MPVARNVCGGRMTSSPACTPATANARWSAAVPLFTATGRTRPSRAASSPSNRLTCLPSLRKPERSVATAFAMACSETVVQLKFIQRNVAQRPGAGPAGAGRSPLRAV